MKLLEQKAGSDVVEEFGDRFYRLIGDVIDSLNFQSDTILSETVLEFLKKRSLYLLSDEKKNYIKVFLRYRRRDRERLFYSNFLPRRRFPQRPCSCCT